MREISQWQGGFDVSRKGFLSALDRRGAVVLVPGGQEEMIGSRSDSNQVCMCERVSLFLCLSLSVCVYFEIFSHTFSISIS